MKKSYLLLTLILLAGCTQKTSSSSYNSYTSLISSSLAENSFQSSFISDSSTSSSSEIISSSSLSMNDSINLFIKELEGYKREVSNVEGTTIQTYYYLTDQLPLEVGLKNYFQKNKYLHNDSYLIEGKGNCYFLDENKNEEFSHSYITHTYNDDSNVYRISYDNEGSCYENEKASYDKSMEEDIYSLSIATIQISLLNQFLVLMNNPYYEGEFVSEGTIQENGSFSFSYGLTIYEEEDNNVIKQTINYDIVLYLENGIIVSSKTTMENALYASGIKANWFIESTEEEYEFNDLVAFEGEVLK